MKNQRIFPIILLLCSVMFFSCRKIINWVFKVGEGEPLTMPVQNYEGTELRLDGYYYSPYKEGYDVYFLYRNGTFNYTYNSPKKITELDKDLREFNWEKYRNERSMWGIFRVSTDNSLEMQQWRDSEFTDHLYSRVGAILNDSTFTITERWRAKDKSEHDVIHEVYRFRQLDFKPDSTNNIIPQEIKNL